MKILDTINKILTVLICVAIIIILWMLASFVDTVMHNLDMEPVYQAWNFFNLFVKFVL